MARSPISVSALSSTVDSMIRVAVFVLGFASTGFALTYISQPQVTADIPGSCAPTRSDYDTALLFSILAFLCVILSVPTLEWVKVVLAHQFREEEKDALSPSYLRWIVFGMQIANLVGYAFAILSIFWSVQVKYRKFTCMATGLQVGIFLAAIICTFQQLAVLADLYLRASAEPQVP